MTYLAAPSAEEEVEFTHLRNLLSLTDGNFCSHPTRPEKARYLSLRRTFVGRKPRTFIPRTPRGRLAFTEYHTAVQRLRSRVGFALVVRTYLYLLNKPERTAQDA